MNDKTDQQLADLISAAKDAGQDAYSFIQAQAPGFVEELIRWKIAEGIGRTLLGAVFLIGAFLTWKITSRFVEDGSSEREYAWIPASILIFSLGFAGLVCCVDGPAQAIQAAIAPKLTVIETISEFIK